MATTFMDMESVPTVTMTPEPIVKTGSSSDITSFDELENVQPSRSPKPKKEAKPESKDSKEKTPPKKESDSEDEGSSKESDSASGEGKEKKTDGKEIEKTKDKEKSKDKEIVDENVNKEKDQPSKLIKVKSGDQEIDLRSDTQFDIKIDGKIEKVTLEELTKDYSGKTNYTKKYTELDIERKAFHTERQELQSGIDKLLDLSKTDKLGAMEYLYDKLGENGREAVKELKAQIHAAFEEWSTLSPEERAQRELKDETDYHKKRADKYEHERVEEAKNKALDTRVQAVKTQYSLDNASFVSRYDELKKFQESGDLKEEITPELIGAYHAQVIRQQDLGKVILQLDLDPGVQETAFSALKSIWDKDPELTVEELQRIASDVYGSSAAKKLAQKIKKSSGGSDLPPPPRKERNEPQFFDDIE